MIEKKKKKKKQLKNKTCTRLPLFKCVRKKIMQE